MSRACLGFATFHATFIVWRQQDHGETDIIVRLDFFDDRASLVSLLVQDDCFEANFFQKAGDCLAGFTVVSMDYKYTP
ncbi:hypothetical protein WJ40_13650 [Burkholderia cepacia]|nr:hypothetical protein WJ40_13650 [Burkholderia cepacia]